MSPSVYEIPAMNLVWALGMILIVLVIYARWSLGRLTIAYASLRMVSQLILIGFFLNYIFDTKHPIIVTLILAFMLVAASWIALRPIKAERFKYLISSLISIATAGFGVLTITLVFVIQADPWYEPRLVIPLAGMILANGMNGVSLCAERLQSELAKGVQYTEARGLAYRASLLPILNAFFSVGLVSLPGMMTGQILAGVSPLIAVRYQIMIMAAVLTSVGVSSAIFLVLNRK